MDIVLIIFALLILAVILIIKCVKIVPESYEWIVEDFGIRRQETLKPGIHIIIPFKTTIRAKVSMKEQTMDVQPQNVITKDNVNIIIDTVVFYQITDPINAVYAIEDLRKSIAYMAQTTVRNIVGKMNFDDTFSSRELINEQLRESLDIATDPWGCKVKQVEIKDIAATSAEIRDSMEKQMTAERTKRSSILLAEGEKESAIRLAEGQREAKVLEAEAEKEANIKRAEGVRQAKILEATGEAEAIERIAEAKAREIEMVYNAMRNANPDDRLVALKSLEALERVADGKANKVFIPFDATKTLASIGSIKEITKE